jgi:hypothetical protein
MRTQQPDSINASPVTIDSLTQDMVLYSFQQSFHAGYSGKIHPLELSTSIDAQPGELRGTVDTKGNVTSYSYFSIIPNLQTTWNLNKWQKLKLSYDIHPDLPTLQQLSPYSNITNPQYPITGNPALKSAYTSNISLRYEQSSVLATQFSGLGIGLSFITTQHPIIQKLTLPKNGSQIIQSTTYINAGSTTSLHAEYYLNSPAFFAKHMRVNTSGGLTRSQAITMTDSLLYYIRAWVWSQSVHIQYLITNLLETNLEVNYSLTHSTFPASGNLQSTSRTASFNFSSRHYLYQNWLLSYRFSQSFATINDKLQPTPAILTASIQRQSLFHKKGAITFAVFNLLNQSSELAQSDSPTGFSQTRSVSNGRYLLMTFQLKINHFHK